MSYREPAVKNPVYVEVAEAKVGRPTEPTYIVAEGAAQTLVAIFDGSGDWGEGVRAARVVRRELSERWASEVDALDDVQIEADLLSANTRIPTEFLEVEEFGCSFSVVACLVAADHISIVAAGLQTACVRGSVGPWRRLFKPNLYLDHLMAEGKLAEAAAAGMQPHMANICVGPFLGSRPGDALFRETVPRPENGRLLLGHNRALAKVIAGEFDRDASPARIRDESEQYGRAVVSVSFGGWLDELPVLE